MDGVLDEWPYQEIVPASEFVQQLPDEGAAATEKTEAWVFFDERHVYVGVRLWDSEPEERWIANEMRRDSIQLVNNDSFSVVFDTFYDRRNGVAFLVNPLGGVFDYEISDEGNPNNDWNPVWDVRTGRFEGGWTIEMQIPFKSLRYRSGGRAGLGRAVRAPRAAAERIVVPDAGPDRRQAGHLPRVVGGHARRSRSAGHGTNFEIKPYGIASATTDLAGRPALSGRTTTATGGTDAKWGLTQNLIADFTYNTDFAQVEVDEQQVNLTRFSLFLPEKREFFLEGRGIFDFGSGPGVLGRRPGRRRNVGIPGQGAAGGDVPLVFFSRRIGLDEGQSVPIRRRRPVDGQDGTVQRRGAEHADRGRARRGRPGHQLQRRPGEARHPPAQPDRRHLHQPLGFDRWQRVEPGRRRRRGVRVLRQPLSQRLLRPHGDARRGRGRRRATRPPSPTTATFTASRWTTCSSADNFNPEVGFVRRDDIRKTFLAAQYSPRPRSIEAVRQFTWGASLDYIENLAGQLETRAAQLRFSTGVREQRPAPRRRHGQLRTARGAVRGRPGGDDPPGSYSFPDLFLWYSMGPQRRISGTAFVQFGGFYSGDIAAFGFRQGRIEITRQMYVEPTVSINRIDLPEGRFTAALVTSRLTYTFTPRMFFSG